MLLPFAAAAVAFTEEPPRSLLHVATLNLAHGRALTADQFGLTREQFEVNIDAVAVVLRRENPDVIALQEADAPSTWSGLFDHVERLVRHAGYEHVHHGIHMDIGGWGVQARYGTALLSHLALDDRRSFTFTAQGLHRKGFVTAATMLDGRSLLLVSLHLDSQGPQTRKGQVELVVKTLDARRMPMIVMGDFNSRWENRNDAVRQIAERLDLVAYQPDAPELLTFRSDRLTKRIDWILISPELEFVSYRLWSDRVSDHLGVAAEVRWKVPR